MREVGLLAEEAKQRFDLVSSFEKNRLSHKFRCSGRRGKKNQDHQVLWVTLWVFGSRVLTPAVDPC